MLKNISWQNFILILFWMLVAWYCFVAITYYPNDIRRLFRFNRVRNLTKAQKDESGNVVKGADSFEQSKNLRDDIANILQRATQNKFPKEELMMALQLRVREYPLLRQSAFQVAINHYIACESEKQCSMSFSDEELRGIWMS